MSTEDFNLNELEALAGAATPGPWGIRRDRETGSTFDWLTVVADSGPCITGDHLSEPDAAFIAAARTAVPALIERVKRAEGKLHRLLAGRPGHPDACICQGCMATKSELRARAEAAEARVSGLENELHELKVAYLAGWTKQASAARAEGEAFANARIATLEAALRTCESFLRREHDEDFNAADAHYARALAACDAALNGTDGGDDGW